MYRCPPKATHSPKTMSIWNFYRYWRRFLMGFPLVGLVMVEKEPIVDRRRPKFTRLVLVAAVRCFWLRNCLQSKMRWKFRDSNYVWFSHGVGLDDGVIGGRLVAYFWTRLRVRMESGSTEFLCSVASMVSVVVNLAEGWVRQSMSIEGGRRSWEEMDSSSYVMMWGDWGFGSGIIVDGRPVGVAISVKLLDLGSM